MSLRRRWAGEGGGEEGSGQLHCSATLGWMDVCYVEVLNSLIFIEEIYFEIRFQSSTGQM